MCQHSMRCIKQIEKAWYGFKSRYKLWITIYTGGKCPKEKNPRNTKVTNHSLASLELIHGREGTQFFHQHHMQIDLEHFHQLQDCYKRENQTKVKKQLWYSKNGHMD